MRIDKYLRTAGLTGIDLQTRYSVSIVEPVESELIERVASRWCRCANSAVVYFGKMRKDCRSKVDDK